MVLVVTFGALVLDTSNRMVANFKGVNWVRFIQSLDTNKVQVLNQFKWVSKVNLV